jgi:hypothetical protein
MPQYSAHAIAALYALAGLLPLASRDLRRPLLWFCFLSGVIAGYFTREAVKLVGELLAPISALATGPASVVVAILIAASVGELLKALGPLSAILLVPTNGPTGLAYGAAAGAGFGFVVIQQGLAMALGLVGSPFITPVSMAAAIAGWFVRLLPHVATTAYVGRAGATGGVGVALLFVCALQLGLGLAERLPFVAGIPMGLPIVAIVSILLYTVLLKARRRGAEVTEAGE